jgi:hypothetical protein
MLGAKGTALGWGGMPLQKRMVGIKRGLVKKTRAEPLGTIGRTAQEGRALHPPLLPSVSIN